jgi:SPP1 family predicted phage head-tail adaptor
MISAGKLNRHIVIQHLEKEKDEYGYERETWADVYSCRAWIYMRKDTTRGYTEYEATNVLEMVCIIRHIKDCVKYCALDYRILYDGLPYSIIGIDNENITQTKFILKQLNT